MAVTKEQLSEWSRLADRPRGAWSPIMQAGSGQWFVGRIESHSVVVLQKADVERACAALEAFPSLLEALAEAQGRLDDELAAAHQSDDDLEAAWGLIANAGYGDWRKEGMEWSAAAERWRDRVMPGLSRRAAARSNVPAPPEPRTEEPADICAREGHGRPHVRRMHCWTCPRCEAVVESDPPRTFAVSTSDPLYPAPIHGAEPRTEATAVRAEGEASAGADADTLHEALQRIHRVALGQSDRPYMSIPADPKRDADPLIDGAIRELVALRAEVATLKAERDEARNGGYAATEDNDALRAQVVAKDGALRGCVSELREARARLGFRPALTNPIDSALAAAQSALEGR
ncbi:MAG: hypothetical protein WC876_01970 [Candidatus Thermoplasmatota archaeon]|jgi:hypothetical protein